MRGDLFAEDIEAIFDELNDMLYEAQQSAELHKGIVELTLAGSAPLIYNNWIPYGTDDVDYVTCTSRWLCEKLPDYHINNRITAFGDSWPYNYEDRIEKMYEADCLIVYQMCLEDLIFMKLSRWSTNDIEDIGAMIANNIPIDFDFLDYLVYNDEEARGAGMSDKTYEELLVAYKDFKRRLQCGEW